jgi:hypothetical protein
METVMLITKIQDQFATPVLSRAGQIGKGVMLAGAIAALTLSTAPTTAHAGNGLGAAIGLGVLGGVIAGAAIASSAPPVYGAPPPPAYSYPPQSYPGYYAPAPVDYAAPQPYYGWTPYR